MVSFAEALAKAKKEVESKFLAKTNVLEALAGACDRALNKLPDDAAYRRWADITVEGFKA